MARTNTRTPTHTHSRTRLVRLLAVPAAALVGAFGLAGCSSGPSQRTATATFSDVGDLANGAQVQLADVPVGSVTSIALNGNKAKVTLAFDDGVRVPANVHAAIDRTTILGDQFVELTVPKSDTGPAAATVPQLADGATITHTSLVPDVEQFVAAGSQVFGAISSSELAQIVEAGGEGFTGQAATLKAFLEDLNTVTTGYAQHTDDLTQAVNGLNSLTAQLAPGTSSAETALDNLTQTVSILAKNSQQFETLLQSLDNLSTQGSNLLETYYPQIVTQLQTLQAVSGQLAQHQADLAGLLAEIPAADKALPQAVRGGYVQLYENIIVCGLPGGGEDDSQPAFSCAKSGSGSTTSTSSGSS
jgi:phospholipid/cholesterol/gamma-HCH transport system substrate-binding protein